MSKNAGSRAWRVEVASSRLNGRRPPPRPNWLNIDELLLHGPYDEATATASTFRPMSSSSTAARSAFRPTSSPGNAFRPASSSAALNTFRPTSSSSVQQQQSFRSTTTGEAPNPCLLEARQERSVQDDRDCSDVWARVSSRSSADCKPQLPRPAMHAFRPTHARSRTPEPSMPASPLSPGTCLHIRSCLLQTHANHLLSFSFEPSVRSLCHRHELRLVPGLAAASQP